MSGDTRFPEPDEFAIPDEDTDQDFDTFDHSSRTPEEDASIGLDDDYMDSMRNKSRFNGKRVWNKMKYWWWRQPFLQGRDFFKSNADSNGIQLYELDSNGNPIHPDGDDEFNMNAFPHFRSNRRRFTFLKGPIFKKIIPILIVLSLFIFLMVKITKSTPSSKNYFDHNFSFDPYIKYSNGTMDFYPITILLSISGFHPSLISAKNTPFLHGLYSLDLADSLNITTTPYMLPSFPSESISNLYSILTGQYPENHGALLLGEMLRERSEDEMKEDEELGWNSYNISVPLWSSIESAYSKSTKDAKGNFPFKVASSNWPILQEMYDNSTLPYYYDEEDLIIINADKTQKKKQDKIAKKKKKYPHRMDLDNIFQYVDMTSIDERPQLILDGISELLDYSSIHGYSINDPEFESLLSDIDEFVEALFSNLQERNLLDFTNVLIFSENGVNSIALKKNVVFWEDVLPKAKQEKLISHVVNDEKSSAFVVFVKKDVNINEVYHDIKKYFNYTRPQNDTSVTSEDLAMGSADIKNHFKIYLNGNFPPSFKFNKIKNFNELDMMNSIWIIPDSNYSIMTKSKYKTIGKEKSSNKLA